MDPSGKVLSHSAAVRPALVTDLCSSSSIIPHILGPLDPPPDQIMPPTRTRLRNVAKTADGPDAATLQPASPRGGTARESLPGPAPPSEDPMVRACEFLPTLSCKNLVSLLLSVVPGRSRRSARTNVVNGGSLRSRGRKPFSTAAEEDFIVDGMGVWAAHGLLLNADTLRLLLKDYITGMNAARYHLAQSYFGADATP